MKHWTRWLSGLAVAWAFACVGPARAGSPVVAAASDLQHVMVELVDAFAADTGLRLRVTHGASGNLARQIRAGAPFELFLSADEQFVLDLHRDGLARDPGHHYATGRLALVVTRRAGFDAAGGLPALGEALADGRVRRLAIANPDHAPYGRRAAEALAAAGLSDTARGALVLGENVAQAAQFVFSGNAQAGLVASSMQAAAGLPAGLDWYLVPEDLHAPLRQRMVLLPGATDGARAFHDWLLGEPARAILRAHGFMVPEAP